MTDFFARTVALTLCGLSAFGCSDDAATADDGRSGSSGQSPDAGPSDGGDAAGAPGSTAGSGGESGNGGRGGTAGSAGGGGASNAADAGDGSTGADAGSSAGAARLRWTESPWGVAPSHSSSVGITSWASQIAESGIDWIRGFDGDNTQAVLQVATTNGFHVAGIFMFSDPGGALTFPVNSLDAFKGYVTDQVEQTRDVVKHWEVWNEPPNFSENKSAADYAKVVIAAYDAVKAADPTVQVGLAAQSVNLNFLADTLDAGAADHFDYVTVHPYETLGLVDDGWEAEFMSIVPTIRKLLADKNPAKQDVPVWFTELGEPVQGAVTPEHQADTLVKAYVMGLAQGARRIHWFEPLDGDSGPFGLIGGGSGSAPRRPSFTAVQTLIAYLGKLPTYIGWTLLNDEHYAFVFEGEGADGAVMIAWSAKDVTDTIDLGASVHSVDLRTSTVTDTRSVELTHSPVLISGVPEALVSEAEAHAGQAFPWGGDYSNADTVSYTAADGARGLHPLGTAVITTIDGAPARDVSQGPGLAFTVDPSFQTYDASALRVSVVLRRNGADNAGFNLKYESTTGYRGTGAWYTLPGDDQWYTQSWTLSDTQFVGKWGYHFSFDSDSTQNSNYSIQSVTVTRE